MACFIVEFERSLDNNEIFSSAKIIQTLLRPLSENIAFTDFEKFS